MIWAPDTQPRDAPGSRCRRSCCWSPYNCAKNRACTCHREDEGTVIGPKIPKLTRAEERAAYEAVTVRDRGVCVRCGRGGPVERDHRQNRDAYNTTPANLQLLGGPFGCGCHLWKTENPADAVAEGFAVPRWARPELFPAWRHGVGWVLYYDTPVDGAWWQEITETTAELLRGGGR